MNNKSVDGNITAKREAKTIKKPTDETISLSSGNGHPVDPLVTVSCESCRSYAASRGQTSAAQPQASKSSAAEIKPKPQASESAAKQDGHEETQPRNRVQLDLGSDSCFIINPAPCMYCTFGLLEGDPKYLCRIDCLARDGRCVECTLAGKRCTWVGFKPPPEECLDLITSRKAACLLLHKTGHSENAMAMLRQMTFHAKKYVAAMWNHANLWELFDVHWKPDVTETKGKKKTKKRKKGRKPKSESKEASTDKDASAEVP